MQERATKNGPYYAFHLFNGESLHVSYYDGTIMLFQNNGIQSYVKKFTEEEMNQDKYHEFTTEHYIIRINFFKQTGDIHFYPRTVNYADSQKNQIEALNAKIDKLTEQLTKQPQPAYIEQPHYMPSKVESKPKYECKDSNCVDKEKLNQEIHEIKPKPMWELGSTSIDDEKAKEFLKKKKEMENE